MTGTAPAAQEWFSAAELAERRLPGLASTKRGVQLQADREGWANATCDARGALARKRKGRGGGIEFHLNVLPDAARAQIMGAGQAADEERLDRESMWLRWERLPAGIKAKAQWRLEIIDRVEQLQRVGMGRSAAVDEVVKQTLRLARAEGRTAKISSSQVWDWFGRIAGVEASDRAVYLAPNYAGRAQAAELCSAEAYEFYKGDYLRLSKPPHAACYRRLQRVAAENGWAVPSLKTLQRRLEAEISPNLQTYLRDGAEDLKHSFPHLVRDRSTIAPMQILNLDGHTWDVRVKWPDGTVSRPHALVVQDIASGKILAIRHDMTLNHHLVRLALGDTFRDHGLCNTVLMDNGRENAAQAISGGQHRMRWGKTPTEEPDGMLKTLGVKAVAVTPYHGQAKPIERAFRNFAHDLAKSPEFEGATTGHTPVDKPANYGERAVPLAEFEHIVRREVAFYNAQSGRTGQGMNGRSFDQVFAEGISRRPQRRLTPEQLRLCMLAAKGVSMDQKSGAVTVEGHRYWSPELGAVKRQKVTVRFDPERMDQPAYVYSQDGRLLAEASRIAAGNFDSRTDAQAHSKARRDYVRTQKQAAEAARRLHAQDLAARLAPIAPPTPILPADAKVVALNFTAPRTPDQLGRPEPTDDFMANWERGVASITGR